MAKNNNGPSFAPESKKVEDLGRKRQTNYSIRIRTNIR